MALTRNEAVVIEKHGVSSAPSFTQAGQALIGQVLGPHIDLRIFLSAWHYGYALIQPIAPRFTHSLQFFDQFGDALFKVYLKDATSQAAYNELVKTHMHPDQTPGTLSVAPRPHHPTQPDNPSPDVEAFLSEWATLNDTHEFFNLIRRHALPRHQAVRLAKGRFTWQVQPNSVRTVLEAARDSQTPIMAFVGNRGCIEIHTGCVSILKSVGPWYNVLDPDVNLHIYEPLLAEAYVVEKPTADGIVTALEVYDGDHELVLQLFGERKPGKPELDAWRQIIARLKPAIA
jgi:putative hemin transport protein